MNLCSLKTAWPYTAMCSSTECRQFCSAKKEKTGDDREKGTFNDRKVKGVFRFLTYTGQMSDHHIVPYRHFPIVLLEYKVFLNSRKEPNNR